MLTQSKASTACKHVAGSVSASASYRHHRCYVLGMAPKETIHLRRRLLLREERQSLGVMHHAYVSAYSCVVIAVSILCFNHNAASGYMRKSVNARAESRKRRCAPRRGQQFLSASPTFGIITTAVVICPRSAGGVRALLQCLGSSCTG